MQILTDRTDRERWVYRRPVSHLPHRFDAFLAKAPWKERHDDAARREPKLDMLRVEGEADDDRAPLVFFREHLRFHARDQAAEIIRCNRHPTSERVLQSRMRGIGFDTFQCDRQTLPQHVADKSLLSRPVINNPHKFRVFRQYCDEVVRGETYTIARGLSPISAPLTQQIRLLAEAGYEILKVGLLQHPRYPVKTPANSFRPVLPLIVQDLRHQFAAVIHFGRIVHVEHVRAVHLARAQDAEQTLSGRVVVQNAGERVFRFRSKQPVYGRRCSFDESYGVSGQFDWDLGHEESLHEQALPSF
jgi:hypothetical protein